MARSTPTLCIFMAMSVGNISSTRADEFEDLRAKIKSALVEEQVPSLAVAVARGGQIVWEEGFGLADRENRVPATQHTLYSLASISKPITATGLMVLVERGAAALDRPANDFLGESKLTAHRYLSEGIGEAGEATLRRLANHTSGLPLHYHFFYADEPFRRPAMDETIRRYGHLVNPPGETYRYANLGYGVLDYVLARTSGKSYADFMRREVFLPLGLTHMSVNVGAGLEKQQALRYGEDGLPLPFYEFDHPGGSAVYASAHDLLRFGMFHLKARQPDQKAILSDESIDEMQRPTADVGGDVGYGVGWFVNPNEHGFRTVSHSGGMGGVRTRLVLVPSENIAVVTLCNTGSELPMRMAGEILGLLLPQYGESLRAVPQPPPAGPAPPAPFAPGPELAGQWEGNLHTYEGGVRISMSIRESGDVHVRLGEQLETLLNEPQFKDGYLTGVFASDIGTADANRRPYHLHLNVKLRDKMLNGSITAMSLPGGRPGNALSHWVELRN